MSSQDQTPPEERLKELETEYKKVCEFERKRRACHNQRTKNEITGEAVELCSEHKMPAPPWVDLWHLSRDPFLEHTTDLEKAFKAGNFGALSDMIYWAEAYNEPLPKWASDATIRTIKGLARDEKPLLGAWKKWFRKYEQNMNDYEIYETIKEARGEYLEQGDDRKPVEWCEIYEVAGALVNNQHPEDSEISENTIKKAYQRVKNGLEKNPLQYKTLHTFQFRKPREKIAFNPKLWQWVEDTIKNGNPKKRGKKKL